MNKFYINTLKLYRALIPRLLRNTRLVAIVDSMMKPFDELYSKFFKIRKNNLYYLAITPQVVKLEKALNDRFDYMFRRIYITDAAYTSPVYLHRDPELDSLYLGTIFVPTNNEIGYNSAHFIVNIPEVIVFTEIDLKAVIDTYKLISKTYTINII